LIEIEIAGAGGSGRGVVVPYKGDDSLCLRDALEQGDVEEALVAFGLPKDTSHFVRLRVNHCSRRGERTISASVQLSRR